MREKEILFIVMSDRLSPRSRFTMSLTVANKSIQRFDSYYIWYHHLHLFSLCPRHTLSSVSLVAQSCPTLCDPIDYSTPGLPVNSLLQESMQTHAGWVGDAIQTSHSLSSPSPPAFNLSQYQGLLKWVSYLHWVAKILEFQLQHQSFQWTPKDWSPLGWTGWISLQSKGLLRVFPNTTVQKHQFFGAQFFS